MIEIIPNLHPLTVHFPIALAVVALVFQTGARLFAARRWAQQWAVVGHWALWIAALSAVVAVFFGWQAFNSVDHDAAGHLAMLVHRAWAVPSAAALVVLAAWDAWRQPAERANPWWFVALLAGAVAALGATAWHGAGLVYRHGLGVIQPPRLESSRDAALPPAMPAAETPVAKRGHLHRDGSVHAH
jgi:uncharacterized membrane protein